MTRGYLPAVPPAIALAVHRAAEVGTPESQIGQTVIEREVRAAIKESQEKERGR